MRDSAVARRRMRTPGRGRPPADSRHIDFRSLLGRRAWLELPVAVRERFRADLPSRRYDGTMAVRASTAGFLIAQACRLIGRPLAPWRGEAVRVSVTVYTDAQGALVWDRLYRFDGRRPVFVSSRKVADGRGLVEIVRGGLGMVLALSVEDGALHFRSRSYFWEIGGWRIGVPGLATPGAAHVVHRDEGQGRFRFTLAFRHPWFGLTLFQEGVFRDP